MTADIRAAAQREAERIITHEMHAEAITGALPFRVGFVDGAAWAQSRVTPTREQIARALFIASDDFAFADRMAKAWDGPGDAGRRRWYKYADAVLALMAGLAEGESNEPGSS